MRYFLLLFIICFSPSLKAQFLEKVYLKDSITIHEGWIIEQVPQEYLKILRSKTRDTITVNVGDIMKISRVMDSKMINKLFKAPIPQKAGYAKAVFLEAGGNGGLYTINYDRRFKKGTREGWGFRAGMGYFRIQDMLQTVSAFSIPIDINYLVGKRKGALELGVAATYFSTTQNGQQYNLSENAEVINEGFTQSSDINIIGSFNIAYRHRSVNNGFMYKVGITPIIYPNLYFNIGISLGYHFQKK